MTATLGAQSPSVCWVPEYVSSAGAEAVELAAMAGLNLDPWQAFVLEHALGERDDGTWAAFEIGLLVSRQNGKGSILEARELAGLFLLGERLIIHSAHQFDTSLEAFRRLCFLIEDTPDFDRRIKRVSRSHGEEGIELKGGQRIRFRTRTKGGGRGFSGDCLILDEAMILPESSHGALLPTLAARPNPQVWYTGSAVDQVIHDDGVVFARIRERGHRGGDPRLAYFDWSIPQTAESVTDAIAGDQAAWALANPGLGIRISAEHVESELRSMDPRTFAVERLGAGDWPATGKSAESVIDPAVWAELAEEDSAPAGAVGLAFDVSMDRAWASVAAAGFRPDGLAHVEVIERRRGTTWLPDYLAGVLARNEVAKVVCDGRGPAGSLIPELEQLGIEIEPVSTSEVGNACGLLFDQVIERKLRHLGSAELAAAVKAAKKRPLGDGAWAWGRKSSAVDISPLVAATLARWALETAEQEPEEPMFAWA